eukprot:6203752-Pleurochrysis_carterae.AAC.1
MIARGSVSRPARRRSLEFAHLSCAISRGAGAEAAHISAVHKRAGCRRGAYESCGARVGGQLDEEEWSEKRKWE